MSATHFSGPVAVGGGSYESLITTRALTKNDNGKTFGLNLAGGFTVTLPDIATVSAGYTVKFRVETQPTTAYIITENATFDTDILIGHVTTSTAQTSASDFASDTTVTQINFVATAAEAGDTAIVTTNGTNWFVEAVCTIPTGITLT